MTGMAYDTLRNMVQLAAYALKATVGPRYKRPNRTLKTNVKTIVRTGTLRLGDMCEKLVGMVSFCGETGTSRDDKLVMIYDSPISCHGVHESARARNAPIRSIDETYRQHQSQNRRGGTTARRLENELRNGHVAGRRQDHLGICHAEQDNDDEYNAAGFCWSQPNGNR